jgi:serine phosphatase RsbU (regulator of sigma subunit)
MLLLSVGMLSTGPVFSQTADSIPIYEKTLPEAKSAPEKIRISSRLCHWYLKKADAPKAISLEQQILKDGESLKDSQMIGEACLNLASAYFGFQESGKALDNIIRAEKYLIANPDLCAYATLIKGEIFYCNSDYKSALKYFKDVNEKSHKYALPRLEILSLTDIGNVYFSLFKADSSLYFYNQVLQSPNLPKDSILRQIAYVDMGNVYVSIKQNKPGKEYILKALNLALKINLNASLPLLYYNLAGVEYAMGDFKEAGNHLTESIRMGKTNHDNRNLLYCYKLKSQVDSCLGQKDQEISDMKQFVFLNDSIHSNELSSQMAKMETQFNVEKKESQIKLLVNDKEKQREISIAEHKRNLTIFISVIGGLLLTILFSIFMFSRWRITQRQKTIIEKQKKLVDQQKALVDEKNKDITDSINYAKRIQNAKLPKREEILASFPQSFVLFKPKDIVSGDFYFFQKSSGKTFIASCDCTGHGIPGAFMSLIGSDKLEEAVLQSSDASEILSLLNRAIKSSLRQSESAESTRDGMDIVFCSIDLKSGIVEYAGANRPLWIIRKGKPVIEEIKATKKAIAGFTEDDQRFEKHVVQLQKGDSVYLFTDGYADLFGGPVNKKMTTKKFKEVLLSIQDKEMSDQEKCLADFADRWRGSIEQVDDILVVGVRL